MSETISKKLPFNASGSFQADSGTLITRYYSSTCKNYLGTVEFIPKPALPVIIPKAKPLEAPKPKFLTISGNIAYDYYYRSRIDTPISQANLQQHTERIYLDVLIKEKYPIKVALVARQSNSPFFRNFFDMNFNFDRFAYSKNLKQQLLNKLATQIPNKYDLMNIEDSLKNRLKQISALKQWLQSPATLQKIIEEKERKYFQSQIKNTPPKEISAAEFKKIFDDIKSGKASMTNKSDSLLTDAKQSIENDADTYSKKKNELDSLTKKIFALQAKADSIKNASKNEAIAIKQKIYKATSDKDLKKIARDNGIDLGKRDKFEEKLAAIRKFSIGRSLLNYTELTAQNITVTGINIEYNPSYYAAFAAGKIDYRFRDFFNKRPINNSQYLVMGRVGLGDIERRALIFSLFQGRKSTSEFSLSDSVKNSINIMGYSVEAIFKKDANTSFSAEFAKSTKPIAGTMQATKQTAALWAFDDRTNMGINIKAQTIIPETKTKLSGFYRKTGENFQSFSLFTYNTDQTAWLARADQSFLKNKISITGMLRRNDFTNPFTDKTFKTSTVFKSILLNVRIPKYPSLSLGYYPGTQLYVINDETIRENAYYIMNGSLVYSYVYKDIRMNSSFMYNRYFNEATDSGFVLYKGVNYFITQSLFFKKLKLQGGYANSKQPFLNYTTLEASGDYALKKWLKIGTGIKYNQVKGGSSYVGGRAMLIADFKQLGGFQFQYERSYLPTLNHTLYPVEIGRVSWYKYF